MSLVLILFKSTWVRLMYQPKNFFPDIVFRTRCQLQEISTKSAQFYFIGGDVNLNLKKSPRVQHKIHNMIVLLFVSINHEILKKSHWFIKWLNFPFHLLWGFTKIFFTMNENKKCAFCLLSTEIHSSSVVTFIHFHININFSQLRERKRTQCEIHPHVPR